MLPGSEIFNLFFEGCKIIDLDEHGNAVAKSLNKVWFRLEQFFKNALNDITATTNVRFKSSLENWYEILKRVMGMWQSRSDMAGWKEVIYDKINNKNGP